VLRSPLIYWRHPLNTFDWMKVNVIVPFDA
jgi:hypothetical protein